jgi:hypothetical protein
MLANIQYRIYLHISNSQTFAEDSQNYNFTRFLVREIWSLAPAEELAEVIIF